VPAAAAVNGNGKLAMANGNGSSAAWRWIKTLSNPVAHRESVDDAHHIYFQGPLVSFNLLHVNGELARMPATAKRVFLHLTDHVPLIDHTSCERLLHFKDECDRNGTAVVELVGLDRMAARSSFPTCMRIRHSRLQAVGNAAYCGVKNTESNELAETATDMCRGSGNSNSLAKDEGGMTWISLSDPRTTADSVAIQPLNRQAQARADMDWLDLEKSNDGEPWPRDRDAQARADMDWLDLEHASGGAAGPGGEFSPS
jgi:hypothetical protein